MHRVLQIAEVLREIIFHCDSRTNFANALVSKTWSEISLDALWYTADLTSFVNLFGELPESRASSNTFKFRVTPTIETWQRFEGHYQRRIRVLKCTSNRRALYLQNCLLIILRTKPAGPLLPNLHTIEWIGLAGLGMAELPIMFFHPKLRRFKIVDRTAVRNPIPDIASFFAAIPSRMPNLSVLEIDITAVATYQAPIAAIIQQLPNLMQVHIPAFHDSTLALHTLLHSNVAQLHCIAGASFNGIDTLNLHADAWSQTLNVLNIRCSYDAAVQIFVLPLALTDVTIISSGPAASFDVQT